MRDKFLVTIILCACAINKAFPSDLPKPPAPLPYAEAPKHLDDIPQIPVFKEKEDHLDSAKKQHQNDPKSLSVDSESQSFIDKGSVGKLPVSPDVVKSQEIATQGSSLPIISNPTAAPVQEHQVVAPPIPASIPYLRVEAPAVPKAMPANNTVIDKNPIQQQVAAPSVPSSPVPNVVPAEIHNAPVPEAINKAALKTPAPADVVKPFVPSSPVPNVVQAEIHNAPVPEAINKAALKTPVLADVVKPSVPSSPVPNVVPVEIHKAPMPVAPISQPYITMKDKNQKHTQQVQKNVVDTPFDPQQVRFVKDELAMLKFDDDDITLGELTETARFEQMNYAEYLKYYNQHLEDIKNQDKAEDTAMFIIAHSNEGRDIPHLPKKQLLNLSISNVEDGNLTDLRILDENYHIIDLIDKTGNNLLHIAASNNNPYLVKWLIMKGVGINSLNYDSMSPIAIAEDGQYWQVFKLLDKAGAK